MTAKPIPDGYHSVTPYLTVRGAAKAIDFLKKAFGAEISHEPLKRPDGTIMHAEVTIGDSRVMIADESEMAKATMSTLYLYVPNVDSVFQQAVKADATKIMSQPICFTGIEAVGLRIPPETAGSSQRTRKMSRRQKWRNAPRPLSNNRRTERPERIRFRFSTASVIISGHRAPRRDVRFPFQKQTSDRRRQDGCRQQAMPWPFATSPQTR